MLNTLVASPVSYRGCNPEENAAVPNLVLACELVLVSPDPSYSPLSLSGKTDRRAGLEPENSRLEHHDVQCSYENYALIDY